MDLISASSKRKEKYNLTKKAIRNEALMTEHRSIQAPFYFNFQVKPPVN